MVAAIAKRLVGAYVLECGGIPPLCHRPSRAISPSPRYSARTVSAAIAGARRCHEEGLLDLIIVDNHSADGTLEVIEREASWARIVRSEKNGGFGRGCNAGWPAISTTSC